MENDEYNGKCPMCSGQLHVQGILLVCENDDYICEQAGFERIWDAYDKDPGDADTLLADLRNLNLKA